MSDETTTEQLAEIEGQADTVQVRQGRWEMRGGHHVSVAPMAGDDFDSIAYGYTWRGIDWPDLQWNDNGVHLIDSGARSKWDLLTYLGPIEQPEPQPEPAVQGGLVRDVTHLLEESGVLDLAKAEQQIEELRSEVSYVQRLLGESRQRVTQLEELVASLRTINEAQEKTVRLAGQENTDLKHRLDVVSAEWAQQSETVRKLQIELDAAQQVPQAVSDRFEEGWDAGTARAVETIAEWLQPIRAVDSEHLANETLQHLPQIMRHLTGLAQD